MNKPKALYIHIPFCNYICDYCDFAKVIYHPYFINKYLDSLQNELNLIVTNFDIDTIFVGGGTPTSLSILELTKLLEMIKPFYNNVKEYTFEANPDSLNKDKLLLLKKYGVNRLSIGVESTSNKILSSINRHHSFEDVINVIQLAREVGFDNINVDLILGLPGTDIDQINLDIENIISLNVNHISCYSLSVNEHTSFYNKGIKEIDDDKMRDYYDLVHEKLEKVGYIHYEISNWAKPNKFSLHNLTYWKDDTYYGIGLGAASLIDNKYKTNTKSISKYIKGDYIGNEESYDTHDANHTLMVSLRTIFGLNLKTFKEKYQIDLYKIKKDEIDKFINEHFLLLENDFLKPTYQGMMILDLVLENLFL